MIGRPSAVSVPPIFFCNNADPGRVVQLFGFIALGFSNPEDKE